VPEPFKNGIDRGLTAKPIIDVVLVVADSASEIGYTPALERAGYSLPFERLAGTSIECSNAPAMM
jgi:GrpB-like predicted nucleotidyltransferase (UPF0157 family)